MKEKRGMSKKAMELDELVKILLAVFFLLLLIGAVVFLIKGRGGEVLEVIKKILRFGRA